MTRARFILALLLLGACGTSQSLSVTVGPDGASVELPGGALLEIPAGALAEDVEVTATLLPDLGAAGWNDLPSWAGGAPFVISLEPHGLQFKVPVTLALPHGGQTGGIAILRAEDEDDPLWRAVTDLRRDEALASVSISGFSGYALTVVKAASCPCFDADDVAQFFATGKGPGWNRQDSHYSSPPTDPTFLEQLYVRFNDNLVDERVGLLTQVGNGPGYLSACTVYANVGLEQEAAPLVSEWFPDVEDLEISANTAHVQKKITVDEGWACNALLGSASAYTAGPAIELCNGLDDDADGTVDEDFDVDGDGVTTCGPDGTSGGTDDDCDDTKGNVKPGAKEACNGVDDDCDGAVPPGETTDGDVDGVPDACDAHPTDACTGFTVDDVREVLAITGAVCLVDATGPAVPTQLQADADSFSGAFIAHTADAWEVVGVAKRTTDTFAPVGCISETTTWCADNGRPPLPAGSEVTVAVYDACKDVAEYACP